MWTYTAPLRDTRFVIEDVLGAPASCGPLMNAYFSAARPSVFTTAGG